MAEVSGRANCSMGVENVKDREGRDKEVRIRDKSVGINGLDEFRCHLHGHLDVINSSIGINFRPLGNKYILLAISYDPSFPS